MKRTLLALTSVAALVGVAYVPATKLSILPAPVFEPPAVRIMFGGDIMLDRNVARSAEEEGVEALLSGVLPVWLDSDARIFNLEGTITRSASIARQDHTILRFTFKPETASSALALLRGSAVSQANNHAYDFYAEGFRTTQRYLDAWGVTYFGHPLNATTSLSARLTVKDREFCLVGYHALFNPEYGGVVEEIARLRGSCFKIIVMPHWGEEYEHRSNAAQQEAARAFIDAGADMVIGAHPHVVQEVEVYKEKPIFYSLGNFLFDQNFSWGTTHGLLLSVDFEDARTHMSLIPIVTTEQHVGLAAGEDGQKTLEIAGVHRDGRAVAEFTLP